MAADPTKVAARTLFEAERVKAEKRYKKMVDIVMRRIRAIIKSAKDGGEMVKALKHFGNSRAFKTFCTQKARQIVTMLATGQTHSWRAAASASSHGRDIFLALQKELKGTSKGIRIDSIVEENAKLIKTVPQDVAKQFTKMAAQAQYEGKRPAELLEIFQQKAQHLTSGQAMRIARTESGKAATALVQARAESLGLPMYRWYSCQDERVRRSHAKMNDVYCLWNDPPNPERLAGEKVSYGAYHPHGIFNCRCEALPVVSVKDIKFPARVHYNGSIRTINNVQELHKIMKGVSGLWQT